MNIKNVNLWLLIIIGALSMLMACEDMEETHREYLQGEKIYAGKLNSLSVYSGYKRVKIVGETKYLGNSVLAVVGWDDNSQEFAIDTVIDGKFDMIVEGLAERSYEFTIYTLDFDGNKSIIQTTRGKSIGDKFKNSQLPRRITGFTRIGQNLTVNWADKAESPFIISTLFTYQTTNGEMKTLEIVPDEVSVTFDDWKGEGKTEVLSKIITGDHGIDTLNLDVVEGFLPSY